MKNDRDYIQDIAAMRTLMERSSKFLSLSGLAGVMAGVYALVGAYWAWKVMRVDLTVPDLSLSYAPELLALGTIVLVLAIGTAILLSYKKSHRLGESFWTPTARRLVAYVAVPFVTGGIVLVLLLFRGMVNYLVPMSLIFYGIGLFNASKFTYSEVGSLGLIQIILGLTAAIFVQYGLLCWAIGFGIIHMVYGIYMHYKYER